MKIYTTLLLVVVSMLNIAASSPDDKFPPYYEPHIVLSHYKFMDNGQVKIDLYWDNIPKDAAKESVMTVTGPNILNIEGGNQGVEIKANTIDNIHFTIKQADETVMKLVYGKRVDGSKNLEVLQSWKFKFVPPEK
jgi:hypothetical protein